MSLSNAFRVDVDNELEARDTGDIEMMHEGHHGSDDGREPDYLALSMARMQEWVTECPPTPRALSPLPLPSRSPTPPFLHAPPADWERVIGRSITPRWVPMYDYPDYRSPSSMDHPRPPSVEPPAKPSGVLLSPSSMDHPRLSVEPPAKPSGITRCPSPMDHRQPSIEPPAKPSGITRCPSPMDHPRPPSVEPPTEPSGITRSPSPMHYPRPPSIEPPAKPSGTTRSKSPREPPRKRRRLSTKTGRCGLELSDQAKSFIDSEARVTEQEEEDEDEEEMEDFIDDTGASDEDSRSHAGVPLARSRYTMDDEQDEEEIVKGIVARAKARGLNSRRSRVTARGEAHSPTSTVHLVSRAAFELFQDVEGEVLMPDVPLFAISMPPDELLELSLLRYLLDGVPVARSAITPSPGIGLVLVEADNESQLLKKLASWPHLYRLSMKQRRPQIVTNPADCLAALSGEYDPESTRVRSNSFVGWWARYRVPGIYLNDLIFILGEAKGTYIAVVVPRIMYADVEDPTPDQRPAPALFSRDRVAHSYPGEEKKIKWIAEGMVEWRGERYSPNGLKIFPIDKSSKNLFEIDGVQPTADELELFLSSGDPVLDFPLLTPSCALQPGDRVIWRTGSAEKSYSIGTGILVRKEQREGTDFGFVLVDGVNPASEASCADGTDEAHPPPVDDAAEVVHPRPKAAFPASCKRKSYADLIASAATGAQGRSQDGWLSIPLRILRHHILSIPRILSLGDRVIIEAGPHIGMTGRISDFPSAREVCVLPSESESAESITVERRHLSACFQLGDVVEVFQGKRASTIGFIVGFSVGGYVELYPWRTARDGKGHKPHLVGSYIDPSETESTAIFIRTVDLKFCLSDLPGTATWDSPSSLLPDLVNLHRERDRRRQTWEKDMRGVGQLLRDMEVMISGMHQEKGKFGTVIGYRQRDGQPAEEECGVEESLADAKVQIRLEIIGRQLDVEVKNLVERHSGLPLTQAALFKQLKMLALFDRRNPIERSEPPLPASSESDISWGVSSLSKLPLVEPEVKPPDVGETTGQWLTHQNLVGKRVDVVTISEDELGKLLMTEPRLMSQKKINNKTKRLCAASPKRPGYIWPQDKPPTAKWSSAIDCLFAAGTRASMPLTTLRPCRWTYRDLASQTGEVCISAVIGRVIVIGPDVDGSNTRVGEYAETIPEPTGIASNFVAVRFRKTRNSQGEVIQPTGRYHLHCLCRSLNQPIPGKEVTCPYVDFDAEP